MLIAMPSRKITATGKYQKFDDDTSDFSAIFPDDSGTALSSQLITITANLFNFRHLYPELCYIKGYHIFAEITGLTGNIPRPLPPKWNRMGENVIEINSERL